MVSSEKLIRKLLKISRKKNHRSLFVILGSNGKKRIPLLCEWTLKKGSSGVLWCKKDDSGTNLIKNEFRLKETAEIDDSVLSVPQFITYKAIDAIQGQSYSFVVLQDFEVQNVQALVTILNAVRGGGVVAFLFEDIQTVEELNSLKLNGEEESRFSKRFMSLLCSNSVVVNGELDVLQLNSKLRDLPENESAVSDKDKMEELLQANQEDTVLSKLIPVCQTLDQSQLLIKFLDAIKEKKQHTTVGVSSPIGRGKSATLGLAIAGSLGLHYSNIFLSSSCPQGAETVFKFLLKGLDALGYEV